MLKPPKTPFDNVWDLVTNLTGSTSTVIGTLSEFFDFQDSPETLDRISSAIKIFRANPSEITRDIYLKAARQSANMRLKGAADAMGIVGNLVDAGDAVKKGLELAEKRGYTGIDKGMAISGEAAKKVLTFFATKNPWAGLVNTAFGGFTEMISGNRYDIGWAIDKGADAWDKTTQEYLSYTNGSLRPGSYTDLLAGDPEIARKDEFLRQVRRIKSQVDAGKLSRQDGAVRIRKLRSTSLGGE